MSRKPIHVAIIPDGNGRWATSRLQPRVFGHKKGAQTLKDIIKIASKHQDVDILSIFIFSKENDRRPSAEVKALNNLLIDNLASSLETLRKYNIRLKVIGDVSCYSEKAQSSLNHAIAETKDNTGLILVGGFYYSGRWDITNATRNIAIQVAEGKIDPQDIDESLVESELCYSELTPPDLLIRTSGEKRISNYMLWQMSYTELYFCDTLWPDFAEHDFNTAIDYFYQRKRRFGKTDQQLEKQHA